MGRFTEDDLRRYLAAFNTRDYETVHSYFDPDVVLELPPGRRLAGKDAIRAHYDGLHSAVRELLALDFCMVSDERIAIELYTEFRAFAARTSPFFGDLKPGDVFRCTNMVHYDLRGGRFHRIRVAAYRVWDEGERTEPKAFPGLEPAGV